MQVLSDGTGFSSRLFCFSPPADHSMDPPRGRRQLSTPLSLQGLLSAPYLTPEGVPEAGALASGSSGNNACSLCITAARC